MNDDFMEGLVIPMPSVNDLPFSFDWSLKLAGTGAKWLRINVPIGCPMERIRSFLDYGWKLLLMFDLPRDPRYAWVYTQHIHYTLKRFPEITQIEPGNEPQGGPDARYTAEDYAALCWTVLPFLYRNHPQVRVWVPGEVLDLRRKKVKPFHQTFRRLLPDFLYYGVAIHPYRNPNRPGWSKWNSRKVEYDAMLSAVGRKPILVTEVGWPVGKDHWYQRSFTEASQRDYLRQEFVIQKHVVQAKGMFVYTWCEERWGLFRPDGSPRPAADKLFE